MIECQSVSKLYQTRKGVVESLRDLDLAVGKGEFVIIRGPSGCGKSTLLFLLGGMLHPSGGRVMIDGQDIYGMSESRRNAFRAERIGFIFQMFHLLPFLDVSGNVELAAPGSVASGARTERSRQLLDTLGLLDRASHRPDQLSAGERQRVAIARALFNEPDVLLADEPTGNLDPENAREVFKNLSRIHRGGKTLVVVTHGSIGDEYADRVIRLKNGSIVPDSTASPA